MTYLPLSTVRYFPELDEANSAPGGEFTVPVALQRNDSDETKPPHELAAEVSYDSGQTWAPAQVRDDNTALLLDQPATGTVSLRATASDAEGNKVEQTIIDAYKLR